MPKHDLTHSHTITTISTLLWNWQKLDRSEKQLHTFSTREKRLHNATQRNDIPQDSGYNLCESTLPETALELILCRVVLSKMQFGKLSIQLLHIFYNLSSKQNIHVFRDNDECIL